MLVGLGFSVPIAALIAAAPAQKPQPTWEYKFVNSFTQPVFPDKDNPDDSPNALGAQGWELVAATVEAGGSTTRYTLCYKRAK
jgi:hypothetical protein